MSANSTIIDALLAIRHHLALVAATGMLSACGGGAPKPQAAVDPSAQGANLSSTCTKEKCPEANVQYSFSGGLLGQTIQFDKDVSNSITISGIDADGTSRRVYVLVGNYPKGSTITPSPDDGKLADYVTISWTPDRIQRNKEGSPFKLVLRDFDRCVVENNEEICQSYQGAAKYDTSYEFSWEVKGEGDDGDEDDDDVFDIFGDDNDDIVDLTDDCLDQLQNQGQSTGVLQGIQAGTQILQGGTLDVNSLLPLFTSMLGNTGQSTINPDDC